MTRILTITGSSGSGKSTIARELLKSKRFRIVTSCTTRKRRATDLEDEYLNLSINDFEQLNREGKFLWTVNIRIDLYGTLKFSVDKALYREEPIISVMILIPNILKTLTDYAGPAHIRSVYIKTPPEVIRERLRLLDPQEVEKRLNDGRDWESEMKNTGVEYHTIFNDRTPTEAAHAIRCLLGLESSR